jgi:hypothetical protein
MTMRKRRRKVVRLALAATMAAASHGWASGDAKAASTDAQCEIVAIAAADLLSRATPRQRVSLGSSQLRDKPLDMESFLRPPPDLDQDMVRDFDQRQPAKADVACPALVALLGSHNTAVDARIKVEGPPRDAPDADIRAAMPVMKSDGQAALATVELHWKPYRGAGETYFLKLTQGRWTIVSSANQWFAPGPNIH